MKSRVVTFLAYTLVVVTLLFVALGFLSNSRSGKKGGKKEEPIEVVAIGPKAINVRMGYDAITAIETEKGIVVIDAGLSNSLTSMYREVIEREFGRNDFIYLINTHSHPDHVSGNQVFADAEIVGHKNCINEIAEYWKIEDKIKAHLLEIVNEYQAKLDTSDIDSAERNEFNCQVIKYRHAYDDLLNDHVVTFPSVTFEDSLDIPLGDRTMNLFYFGKAHSGSDILVHVPGLKLLFTGDLFFPGGRPSLGNSSNKEMEQWKKAVQWLSSRSQEIEVVVGGHGEIMQKDDLESFIQRVKKRLTECNASQ